MAFTPSPGTGDLIDVDPQFADPANGDFSLQSGSPCIASGLDGFDRGAEWSVNRPRPVSSLQCSMQDSLTRVQLSWDNPAVMLDSSALAGPLSARIFRNDSLIAALSNLTPGGYAVFNDSLPNPGNFSFEVSVLSATGVEGIRRQTARSWGGGTLDGIVVWNMDPNPLSKDSLLSNLAALNYPKKVFVTGDPNAYDLTEDVEAVFVFLGIQPNAYLLGEGGSNRLITYLSAGGNVYLEGGDFWSDPNQQSLAVTQFFHIDDPIGPGQDDLTQLEGVQGSMMDGLQFWYIGDNRSVDEISSMDDSELIMRNLADNKGCGVAYNGYLYRTIGTSFQFGGLYGSQNPGLQAEYLQRVLNFFNPPADLETGQPAEMIQDFIVVRNYPNPFNSSTRIEFKSPGSGTAVLEIFNPLGQTVVSRKIAAVSPGWQRLHFDAADLNSGIYFYRITVKTAAGETRSRPGKMIYLK